VHYNWRERYATNSTRRVRNPVIVNLSAGEIIPGQEGDTSDPAVLERDVLLVYAGKFQSMDGEVEITDDHIDKLASAHNSMLSKLAKLVGGQSSLKVYPPVQLDHSTSARDTIGRLVGDVKVGEHVTADGQKSKALFGKVRFLGKENVEKVKDGRWAHVSIGADLENPKIQELTITPFPAAAEASLLSKRRLDSNVAPEGLAEGDPEKQSKAAGLIAKKCSLRPAQVMEWISRTGVDAVKVYGHLVNNELRWQDVKEAVEQGKEIQMTAGGTKMTKLAAPDVFEDRGRKCEVGLLDTGSWYFDVESIRSDGFKDKEAAKAKCKEYVDTLVKEADLNNHKDYKTNLSAGGGMDKKLKKHLMDVHKMSDDEAEQKLEGMSPHEMKKLEHDMKKMEHAVEMKRLEMEMKHLESSQPAPEPEVKAAEVGEDPVPNHAPSDEAKEANMKAAKAKVIELRGLIATSEKNAHLAKRQLDITTRLSRLKAEGKISPAEIKKIEIVKLAAENDATVDAVFKAYEMLEPKVLVGIHGNAKAANLGDVGGKVRMSQLEAETRQGMPSRRRLSEKDAQAAAAKDGVKIRMKGWRFADEGPESVNVHVDATPHEHEDTYMSHEDLCRMLDEGKTDEVKQEMKKMYDGLKKMRHLSDGVDIEGDSEKHLSALANELKTLHNHTQALAKLVETL
jgi:hypothetical protein